VFDTLVGKDAVQRDPDTLDRWACENLMKLSKAKCKVLHMGWGNCKHGYRMGRYGLRAALWRRTWGYQWMRSWR